MNVINTNIGALKAANASNAAGKALGTAMERLSTGKRINSAKDDAAVGFTLQIRFAAQEGDGHQWEAHQRVRPANSCLAANLHPAAVRMVWWVA